MIRSNLRVRQPDADGVNAARQKIFWHDRYLPNARWYLPGAVCLIVASQDVGQNPWFDLYLAVGVIVSTAFMVFKNPKPENKPRYDIAFCVVILAMMWPVISLAMLLEKPWNAPAWKNRLKQDDGE